MLSFLREFWMFLRVRKKYWLIPILIMMVIFGGADRADAGLRSRAVHLHDVLNGPSRMRILGLSAFYHDSAAALVEDGRVVAAAQEERFTRKKHDSGFPHHALAYCLDAAGIRLGRRRLRRVLRQAVPEIRAAAGNLSRLRADGLPIVPDGDPAVAARKAVPEAAAARRAEASSSRDYDWDEQAALHRASPEPRGLRVLPLAVRGSGRPDHGRGRRMGDDVGRLRPRQRSRRSSRSSTSRTRSACCTPPSPTTPGSRSIPASTR